MTQAPARGKAGGAAGASRHWEVEADVEGQGSGDTGESTEVYVLRLRWRRLCGWSSEVTLALETMRTVQV